jgi:hypothetical protein
MSVEQTLSVDSLFGDLVALEENSFPKKCETCGMIYHTVEEFTAKTVEINGRTGFKSSEGDEGEAVIELFRNCHCGSTLLDFFADRRDLSAKGDSRRKAFDKVLNHLVEQGIELETARNELRYYLKHKKSKLLEGLGVFKKRTRKANNT